MNPASDRESTLAAAFRDGLPREPAADVKVGPLKLRRFSLGTLDLCRAMQLTLFTEPKAIDKLTAEQVNDQLIAYAWAQCRPLADEVFPAIDDGTWKTKVRVWKHEIDLAIFRPLLNEIARNAGLVIEAAVDVAARSEPSSASEEAPPPNS